MTPRFAPPSPLNPDLLALLASCRSAPADDTPRLVLADWLEENADVSGLPSAGDARARAALIRVQVELARPTSDVGRVAQLQSIEQRLIAVHSERWLGTLARRFFELGHRPFGFAMHLTTTTPPVYSFEPFSPRNRWRFTRGLLSIELADGEQRDLELDAWFSSPLAAWVEGASITLGGVAALERLSAGAGLRPYLGVRYAVGATAFPTLRNVRPEQEEMTERRCKRLLRSANFALVRELTLYGPAVEVGFPRMMADARVANVRRLVVRVALSDTDAAFLASAPLVNLSALDVSATELTADGMRFLVESPHLKRLVSLSAYRNRFGCAGLVALAESPLANTLNVLELQNTGIGNRGVVALSQSPILGRLNGPALNLSMNGIGNTGVQALAACEHLERFTELVLRACSVSSVGARALARSPHVCNLTYLDLWNNRVGDVGARALAGSPHLEDVCHLSIRDNNITAAGARALRARFTDRVRV